VLNAGRATLRLRVDKHRRPADQVGSHYHFYETNRRCGSTARRRGGFRLNIRGTAVRFEPGQGREVELVAYAGDRRVYGFNGKVMGPLDSG